MTNDDDTEAALVVAAESDAYEPSLPVCMFLAAALFAAAIAAAPADAATRQIDWFSARRDDHALCDERRETGDKGEKIRVLEHGE